MNAQTITTPAGDHLIVLSEADFRTLTEAAEDNADRLAVLEFRRKFATGEEELIPSAVVDRLLGGENRIRVWREHRGLTARALADAAGIAQPFLSQIETGKREGTIETLRKIAEALSLTIDDLVGQTGRGFDLVEFEAAFSFDRFLTIATKPRQTGRTRFKLIGVWNGVTVVVAIVSPLGNEAIDVVSVRPANAKERAAYDEA